MFPTTIASIEHIRAGRLRALAVTGRCARTSYRTSRPWLNFVLDYEASYWFGVCAPNATPAENVEKLNKEVNAGLADPKMKARPADLGGATLAGSPADFGKLLALRGALPRGDLSRCSNVREQSCSLAVAERPW
jgi:tripartite-type tricarboxylate transporter receptor subunit TctC